MKKLLRGALSVSLLCACQNNSVPTQSQSESSDTPLFQLSSIQASGSPDTVSIIKEPPSKEDIVKAVQKALEEEPTPRFDSVPTENPDEAIPGSITVIYKNDSQMRVDKQGFEITSNNSFEKEQVLSIFSELELKHMNDFAPPGISDEELERDVQMIYNRYKVESPNRKSIHVYQFTSDTDTKHIARKLRELPFVVTAYMTPKIEPGASGVLLGEHHLTATASAPSDQGFGEPESYWWWFNRQKVFHAWNYLDNQVATGQLSYSQPYIAVVDTGFDVASSAIDKPLYTSGESVKYDPYSSNPWTIGTDVQQLATDWPGTTLSHGALVASIAASPRNNSTPSSFSLAGITPQATIIPYKLVSYCINPSVSCALVPANYGIHEQTVAHGIFRASYSNADAINISMEIIGGPITYSPAITNEILTAANNRDKVVVIAAGNGGINLNDPAPSPFPVTPLYCNCIVVGGSEYESAAHAKRWIGSSYNRVHLAAGAKDISAATFNPMNNLRFMTTGNGTSLAAPMVAATAGLMKKVAEGAGNYSLTPAKIRNLITYSATASRFSSNATPTTSETNYLGDDLSYYLKNPYFMVGMRELNVYNAIIMAQFSHQYPALARIHNIDDFAWIGFNNSWTDPSLQKGFGMDAIFGVQNILPGDIINFATYNSGTSYNAIAHGYQVYKDGLNIYEWMGGVAYITGAQNNAAVANNAWYQLQAFNFY